MSDKTGAADEPKDESRLVRVRMAPETERQIADLQPAIAAWARDQGLGGEADKDDVIALAIELMHQQVFAKVGAILAGAKAAPRTQH